MNFSDYTTTDEIRALLGVSIEELADEEINVPFRLTELELTLDEVHTDLVSWMQSVHDTPQHTRTAVQNKFYNVGKLYASYCVALEVAKSLAMSAPLQITDGKAELRRADHYMDVQEKLAGSKANVLPRLKIAAIAAGFITTFANTIALPTLVVAAGLAINPVTNAAT